VSFAKAISPPTTEHFLPQEVKRRFSEQGFPSPRTAPDDHGENLIREGLIEIDKGRISATPCRVVVERPERW